ncbi:unnamed protein product, partial [Musa hybrid cultivar]
PAATLFLPSCDCGVSSASGCLPLHRRTAEATVVSSSGEFLAAAFSSVNGGFCVFFFIGETASPPPRYLSLSPPLPPSPSQPPLPQSFLPPPPSSTLEKSRSKERASDIATLSQAATLFLPNGTAAFPRRAVVFLSIGEQRKQQRCLPPGSSWLRCFPR